MTNVLLKLEHLGKLFGGLHAVENVTFEIERGSIVGLIGPNGAGKTTLFNVVSGRFAPTQGRITFKDRDITIAPCHERVRFGLVRTFQSTMLYPECSAHEHIRRARIHRQSGPEAEPTLSPITLLGLDAVADEPARNLPYGQQRALGIATALATNPDLIMLDEPVAGMNATETVEMARMISGINARGITVLVVEHDMTFVMQLCHRVIVLNNGLKIADGSPDFIRKDPVVIAAYLGVDDDVAA